MSIAENLSGWPRSPTAQAASRLVKKGIVVVAGATVVARHPLALDGTTRLGHRRFRLPDGRYYVVMTVEKALADPVTPKESWRSSTFKIDRGRHPG
jgi:hypothetical protein